ncbi:hypothetical protein [Sphingobium sp. KCTC 72723]|uniref:hypothetical protein n=1 Tax=Sphingobium sp. KCTC 72723 TaxID=2733867 RepID=UPI00165D598F|nr:hypothetical protein [Sphingobium sp. KCTC 72723]
MAAKLGGFLPAWRNGHVDDVDLVTTEHQARLIAQIYGQPFSPHAPGSVMIMGNAKFDISYADMAERWALLDQLCPAAQPILVAGHTLSLRVAPAEVVWAIRAYTVGLSPNTYEKGVRDALWYDALPKCLTDDHIRLANLYRGFGLQAAVSRKQ